MKGSKRQLLVGAAIVLGALALAWALGHETRSPRRHGSSPSPRDHEAITLRLVRADSGAPVAGARVRSRCPGGGIAAGRSDEAGRVRLEGLLVAAGPIRLSITAPGLEHVDWRLCGRRLAGDHVLRLLPDRARHRPRGVLTSERGVGPGAELVWEAGASRAGAITSPWRRGVWRVPAVGPRRRAVDFVLPPLPDGCDLVVRARERIAGEPGAVSWQTSCRRIRWSVQPGYEIGTLSLDGRLIQGCIVDETGRPRAGLRVVLRPRATAEDALPRRLRGTTDADGRFEITLPRHAAAVSDGSYCGRLDLFDPAGFALRLGVPVGCEDVNEIALPARATASSRPP